MGTVRPKVRAVIASKITGRIEEVAVNLGQRVEKGQPLVQLDLREVQARLDQATAVLEQANNDLKRFSTLLQQEAVTQAEFDAVQARQRVAHAAVTEAETMLSYAKIVAPFSGAITRKLVDVGDMATPGKPLLEIENQSAFRFEADVPEALLPRIEPGGELPIFIPSLGRRLQGKIDEIAPGADAASRTFLVKLDLPSDPGLRAGQFGRVAVPLNRSAVLRVDKGAVIQRGQLEMVFVVTNQTAQMRLVKTGKRVGDEVELLSGVSTGELVAVEGGALLKDGQPVEIQP